MSDEQLEQRYPDGLWDSKSDYLVGSRILLHNDDYLEFLVTKVWKLDQPCRVVDFGCGSGRFGQMADAASANGQHVYRLRPVRGACRGGKEDISGRAF